MIGDLISALLRKQEPKRFEGSLRGGVALKKHHKNLLDWLGSLLPKCAHSLKTQDQGVTFTGWAMAEDGG